MKLRKRTEPGSEEAEKTKNCFEQTGRKEQKTCAYPKESAGNGQLGQTVYVATLDQKGQVLSMPDQDGNVMVQVGIMKVSVKLSDLRQAEEETAGQPISRRSIEPRILAVSTELDLRGQTAEEAVMETDLYLDNAFLAGLKEVTIIHGKGTGVLRNSIHQLLRQHPHVASFRLGKYGEGEAGVTVVQIK